MILASKIEKKCCRREREREKRLKTVGDFVVECFLLGETHPSIESAREKKGNESRKRKKERKSSHKNLNKKKREKKKTVHIVVSLQLLYFFFFFASSWRKKTEKKTQKLTPITSIFLDSHTSFTLLTVFVLNFQKESKKNSKIGLSKKPAVTSISVKKNI